ncbi:hypothetical protein K0M31_013981 [Melipona bicolor]|uniref:Uncharacterized protein n=1 Tax=Melipona bicolor TaxID=60889 RepID=A0AA40G7V3_9HYME|nr:hypothetical protein K0M31_013981 [Melipona bicolor]
MKLLPSASATPPERNIFLAGVRSSVSSHKMHFESPNGGFPRETELFLSASVATGVADKSGMVSTGSRKITNCASYDSRRDLRTSTATGETDLFYPMVHPG